MKCKKCKKDLKINEKTSSIINGVLIVQCEECGNDNLDVEITNKITLDNLYWNKKEFKTRI